MAAAENTHHRFLHKFRTVFVRGAICIAGAFLLGSVIAMVAMLALVSAIIGLGLAIMIGLSGQYRRFGKAKHQPSQSSHRVQPTILEARKTPRGWTIE